MIVFSPFLSRFMSSYLDIDEVDIHFKKYINRTTLNLTNSWYNFPYTFDFQSGTPKMR